MNNFTVREVLEQAVQTEKLGYRFYTAMAARFSDDDKLVKLFKRLAEKELIHEKTYAELRDMTGEYEPEGWEEISQYLRAIVESEFFIGKGKALTSMDSIKTILDAVNYAFDFEKETLLFFYGIRDAVREKEVIDEIINEERSHIMWLNAFKNVLTHK